MPEGWEWDDTLYSGSAPYYQRGRPPYASGLVDRITESLSLDGTGRLLDVGCGPGIITLPLAAGFREAVGLDPDAAMLAEAVSRARSLGIANVQWIRARAEELPLGLGTFQAAAFAQSFHWMDRPLVAAAVYSMLEPGGSLLHINIVEHTQADPARLPFPGPPYAAIQNLVGRYLGPVRRAGQGVLRHGTPGSETAIFQQAGFSGPQRLMIRATEPLVRDVDEIVAYVFSRSDSAPHLFGEQLPCFEADLRRVLHQTAPEGRFAAAPSVTEVFIWRKGQG